MKIKLHNFLLTLPVISLLPIASCCIGNFKQTQINIYGDSTIKVGESKRYNIIFDNKNLTSCVRWSVSDQNVISIDQDGLVQAHQSGKVQIIATLLSNERVVAYKDIVVVNAKKPSNIIISGSNQIYNHNWQQQYTATVYPCEASQQIIWSVDSSNASISNDGYLSISSQHVSKVKITAMSAVDKNIFSSFDVDVITPVEPKSIEIYGSEEVSIGKKWNYSIMSLPSTIDSVCTWDVLNEYQKQLIDVNKYTGEVIPKHIGEVDLIAKSLVGATCATKHIRIVEQSALPNKAVIVGQDVISQQPSTFSCDFGNNEYKSKVIWSITDNAEIEQIKDSSVIIKPKLKNTEPIYLTAQLVDYPQITLLKKIKIAYKPDSIHIIGPKQNKLHLNQSFNFGISVSPSTSSKNVIWSSSCPDVAYIDRNTGLCYPLSSGTTTIRATSIVDTNIFIEEVITVDDKSVTIIGDDMLVEGNSYKYSAKVDPEEESQDVTWEVSDTTIVHFDEDKDMLQARKTGTVVLTATTIEEPKVSASKTITIYKDVKKIDIVGNNIVPLQEDSTFTITTDTDEGFPLANWSVSDESTATIDNNGVLHPIKDGIITITAKSRHRESVTDTMEVQISSNATKVIYSPTIGRAYDRIGSEYALSNENYYVQFVSTTYKADESSEEDPLPIHKQLKKSDIEVIYDSDNIIESCSLMDNVLMIPSEYINKNHHITINILGGEIAEWIEWHDIQSLAQKDLNDDLGKKPEEITHSITNFFQIGDYKRAYYSDSHQEAGTVRLDAFYKTPFQELNSEHELINYFAPMQFEFEQCQGSYYYDDVNFTGGAFDHYYLFSPWWELYVEDPDTHEIILCPPKLKHDKCDKISLEDISPREVCLDYDYEEHEAPLNDSTFYIMHIDEYNIDQHDENQIEYYSQFGETVFKPQSKKWEPYDYFTDRYHTIKTLAERRKKDKHFNISGNVDDYGYRTRDIYETTFVYVDEFTHTQTMECPGCMAFDGTKCRYQFYTGINRQSQVGYRDMAYCIAFSL